MKYLALVSVMVLMGCALFVPKEKTQLLDQQRQESIASKTTTDVVRETRTSPPMFTVDMLDDGGMTFRVEAPAPSTETSTIHTTTDEKGQTDQSGSFLDQVSIPLFVKIIGFTVGLGLFALLIFWIIRKIRQGAAGQASAAAFRLSDEKIAGIINGVQSRAVSEQSTEAALVLSALTSELEKARGQLAAKAPPVT